MLKAIAALAFCLSAPLSAGHGVPSRPVDLNTATRTELLELPGIGPRTAERIVDFRKNHGGFRRLEEVMNVQGIGEKSFARLRPYLTLGPEAANARP